MRLRYTRRLALLALLVVPAWTAAQEPSRLGLGGTLTANGEAERYLRLLQLTGRIPAHPVGIRPWTRHEAARLRPVGEHPWAARFGALPDASRPGIVVLRPGVGATWNSTLPEGEGEGPVWLGRGVTLQGVAGVRATWGPIDAQLAPLGFWAQNASFTLAPNGLAGAGALRDSRFPRQVDAPQRFGTGSYGRIDPGYSRIGVETSWLSGGFSAAPLAYGPARDEPLVLGPLAGGFPHLFVGSGKPLPVGIGRLHIKLASGKLAQSAWSPMDTGTGSRFATSAVLTFEPRGIEGLEVGAIRFEHRAWIAGVATLENALRPFTGILNDPKRLAGSERENGYASVFARWAVMPAGLEVYMEYGREDYAGNARWLLQKPDDLASLLIGFQRVFGVTARGMNVVRAELVNAELSHIERQQRGFTIPLPPYLHATIPQGHTLRGQFLGSPTAYGGSGWRVGFDQYDTSGRTTWELRRRLIRDWLYDQSASQEPVVWYSARAERMHGRGSRFRDLTLGGGLLWALNQDVRDGGDQLQVQLTASWQGW